MVRWRRSISPDVLIAIGLYLLTLAIYLRAVAVVDGVQVLTGEEASVSIRDVLFTVEQRFQASVYSTNFGAPFYYWAASHLDPWYDLFSARRWKAAAIALLAPLVYVTLRRRLGCGRPAAAIGAGTVALIPGVAAFSWLATENGLEAVWGMVGLLVVTSRRGWWWIAPVLAGVAVTTYPSGLAWAAGIGVAALVRALGSPGRGPDLLRVAAAAAAGAAVVLFPKLWWVNGGRIVTGGGSVEPGGAWSNVRDLAVLLTRNGQSYYYFSDQPALGSPALALAALAGLAAALLWRRSVWPWAFVAVATVVLYAPAGNVPGVRRTIALAVVAALAIGVATDLLVRALASRPALLRSGTSAVAAALVLIPLAAGFAGWQAGWTRGERTLPVDFAFPMAPGATMPETFEFLTAELRAGRLDAASVAATWEGERTLAIVLLLAERNGEDVAGLPTAEQITALTYEGPRCFERCRPVPGRP
ncbi:MAG: hypothetical protein ACRDRZ_07380 [Pseudonocardiaceae bacterium]